MPESSRVPFVSPVWTSPDRTSQIDVDGAGTTWSLASAPTAVWVEFVNDPQENLVAQLVGPGAGGAPAQQVAFTAKSVWQVAINYASTQMVGKNSAPLNLLEWNNANNTPVLEAASTSTSNGNVYLRDVDYTFLAHYATGQLPANSLPFVRGSVESLNNEGFSVWYRVVGGTTWVGDVVRGQTQYDLEQRTYPPNPLLGGMPGPFFKTITREQMAEEAMSEEVNMYSFVTPPPYGPAVWKLVVPGHDGPNEPFRGLKGTQTPLNEMGYITALYVLYEGTQTGFDPSVSYLLGWFNRMF
jgi:hypothetical protein